MPEDRMQPPSDTDAIGRPICACGHRPITHVDDRRECLVARCPCQECTVRHA